MTRTLIYHPAKLTPEILEASRVTVNDFFRLNELCVCGCQRRNHQYAEGHCYKCMENCLEFISAEQNWFSVAAGLAAAQKASLKQKRRAGKAVGARAAGRQGPGSGRGPRRA